MAKVMFLQASVILSTGGVSASVHAGIPPPPRSRHPLGADTPPGSRHPSREQTPPRANTPRSRHPPPHSRLRHTVNERPVCILLECILVYLDETIACKYTVPQISRSENFLSVLILKSYPLSSTWLNSPKFWEKSDFKPTR